MKHLAVMIFALLTLLSCGPATNKTSDTSMDKFSEFKKKEKFGDDRTKHYSGLSNPALKPAMTEIINLAADDFKEVSMKPGATDQDYQDKIKTALERFDTLYSELDTEDRERVCWYFEELMDLVGLQSSGGHLNRWMYGFDPTEFNK